MSYSKNSFHMLKATILRSAKATTFGLIKKSLVSKKKLFEKIQAYQYAFTMR